MLDKNMPIMDGVDVAVTFKKWESEGRFNHKALLVLVTGDEKMVEKHYDKTLFDSVMIKPIAKNNISKILIKSQLIEGRT
jgi:DNA-binding LytR/AlgR family response regulator